MTSLEQIVETFALVLCRVSAFVFLLPTLLAEFMPSGIRALTALVLSMMVTFTLPNVVHEHVDGMMAIREIILGSAMGLSVRIVTSAVLLSSDLIETQMGLGMAHVYDPMSSEQSGLVGQLWTMVLGVLFFVSGMYRSCVAALVLSFQIVPMGTFDKTLETALTLIHDMQSALVVGLKIALPIIAACFSVQLAFALAARLAPQLNIWSISILITLGVGLLSLTLAAPGIVHDAIYLLSDGLEHLQSIVES